MGPKWTVRLPLDRKSRRQAYSEPIDGITARVEIDSNYIQVANIQAKDENEAFEKAKRGGNLLLNELSLQAWRSLTNYRLFMECRNRGYSRASILLRTYYRYYQLV